MSDLVVEHGAHRWKEIAPCVYCADCNVRLYQGTIPASKDPERAARQAACDHDWDPERGLGFYLVCRTCGLQEWTE